MSYVAQADLRFLVVEDDLSYLPFWSPYSSAGSVALNHSFLPVPRCIRVQFKCSFGHLKQGVLHTNYIAIAWMSLLSVLHFYGWSFHGTASVCVKEMACSLHTSNGLPLKCEKVLLELSLWNAAIAITHLVLSVIWSKFLCL